YNVGGRLCSTVDGHLPTLRARDVSPPRGHVQSNSIIMNTKSLTSILDAKSVTAVTDQSKGGESSNPGALRGTGRRDYSTPAHSWTFGCSADRGDHPSVAQRLVATTRCTGVVLCQVSRGECSVLRECNHHHVRDPGIRRWRPSLSILPRQLQSRYGAASSRRPRRHI